MIPLISPRIPLRTHSRSLDLYNTGTPHVQHQDHHHDRIPHGTSFLESDDSQHAAADTAAQTESTEALLDSAEEAVPSVQQSEEHTTLDNEQTDELPSLDEATEKPLVEEAPKNTPATADAQPTVQATAKNIKQPSAVEAEAEKQITKHKDIIAELESAVKREVSARKELEDMLMRMEQHLRTEEEARKNSDRLLDTSLQNEVRLKKELDAVYHQQTKRETEIEQQRHATESERQALEEMRQQMDMEITAVREEAHKAVEDLKTVEDRVRAAERAEMSKMEAEYQKRVSMLGLELERVRQELIIRTKLLSEEMERWRQQAEYTAAAVIEAKAEVTERKRDLDSTRDKMDKLMDRLHLGREHGLVLQASLTAANAYTTQAQRTLIHSMESSFQHNVQQTLPWGGQIGIQNPAMTEEIPDTMMMLNRGTEIPNGKANANGTKTRMLENNKQASRSRPGRNTRRGRS